MKNKRKIILLSLLLSLILSIFAPLMIHAEESYTISGLWLFDEDVEFPSEYLHQDIYFSHVNNLDVDPVYYRGFSVYDNSIIFHNSGNSPLIRYENDKWVSDYCRYIDFYSEGQSVSKEFYNWITSNAHKIYFMRSGVLDDLERDSTFDVFDYPYKDDDYSLEVIQVAEGSKGELFVYVYNPSKRTRDFEAKYINMSIQNPMERYTTLENKLYSLTLISSEGSLDKYIVNDFTVLDDSDRYYNIATIYRPFDSTVDSVSESVESIQCKGYSVGEYWHFYYFNGVYFCERKDIDVVLIDILATGTVRYNNAYQIGSLYYDQCDSHYVAFSIENFDVDQIFDADITYTLNEYSWSETYSPYCYKEDLVNSTLYECVYISSTDTGSNVGNWFTPTYSWNRIQTSADFIKSTKDDGAEFSGNDLAALNGSQFVFRYKETTYSTTPGSTSSFGSYTKAENVGILRLHFLSDGKFYNLGVVSDLVGDDSTPNGVVDTQDDIEKLKEQFEEWMEKILTIIAIVLIVVLLLSLFPILRPILNTVGTGFKEIGSLAWSAVTLPFNLLGESFSRKRGKK